MTTDTAVATLCLYKDAFTEMFELEASLVGGKSLLQKGETRKNLKKLKRCRSLSQFQSLISAHAKQKCRKKC